MAWDSKTRNRGSSSVSGAARGALPLHPKQAKQTTIQPNSAHVADPFLEDFLDPSSFDPVAYLNSVLPPLQSNTGGGNPTKGIEDAARRIEELKELNKVWRGTAEEKGRAKFIESLAKLVEDRHRDLLREMDAAKRDSAASASATDGSATGASKKSQATGGDPPQSESRGYGGGYGFISQLQKIRGGL
ncbi:hypothetical protein MAPG_00767 [Magnaporthiopsis poae ATCC 64411]|uniref:Uncharacterized protein n=1 Tax=Magnaporthiopsis poae (strain ATCC 64411 / 73-15) TaxID=644358 RepID=A0A0C4DLW9_MAGP6|nr:hypothetical protein MAPG_00767 [Magnaporthiopsis poae ATCC 64411]